MVPLPAVGRSNQDAPTKSRMIPRKKVGSDHMKRLKESAETSIQVRRRQAATSPSTTPNRIESSSAGSTSQSVFSSAAPIRSETFLSRYA